MRLQERTQKAINKTSDARVFQDAMASERMRKQEIAMNGGLRDPRSGLYGNDMDRLNRELSPANRNKNNYNVEDGSNPRATYQPGHPTRTELRQKEINEMQLRANIVDA